MRCPFCSASEDKVIETRVSRDGSEIRRRRECESCARRYTTYERIEESMPLVIKNDGRREPFDRAKIEHGLLAAIAKRPVSRDQVSALALEVEREIADLGVSEIASRDIGERVLPRLRALDQVAYVRFASIYRDFRDLEGFEKELDALRNDTPRGLPRAEDAWDPFPTHDPTPSVAGPHALSDETTDEHAPVHPGPPDPAEQAG